MNNKSNDKTRFLPLSVALLILMTGWGLSLLLSLVVNASFFSGSYSVLAISLILLELIFLFPAYIYLRQKHPEHSVRKVFRLNNVKSKAWPGIILFIAGIIILSDTADRILGKWIVVPEEFLLMMAGYKWSSFLEAILMIFAACIVASFAEECVFRGMLLQTLEETVKKPLAAVIFSAFLFAMIHAMPWYFIQIVTLGILLGGMSYLFNSILPGIVLHSAYNLVSLIMLNINQEPVWYTINGHVRNIWIVSAGLLVLTGYYLSSPFFSIPARESVQNQI